MGCQRTFLWPMCRTPRNHDSWPTSSSLASRTTTPRHQSKSWSPTTLAPTLRPSGRRQGRIADLPAETQKYIQKAAAYLTQQGTDDMDMSGAIMDPAAEVLRQLQEAERTDAARRDRENFDRRFYRPSTQVPYTPPPPPAPPAPPPIMAMPSEDDAVLNIDGSQVGMTLFCQHPQHLKLFQRRCERTTSERTANCTMVFPNKIGITTPARPHYRPSTDFLLNTVSLDRHWSGFTEPP